GVLRGAAMLGYPKDGKRTIRDRTIQLHDLLSPAFVWYHQYDEVKNWAQDAGFQNIQETVYSGNNGYPHAVQDVLDKYLLICRPGFGMLARY
ncbi:MAG: hypothetical protein ACE5G1_11265, partial [bacterium]